MPKAGGMQSSVISHHQSSDRSALSRVPPFHHQQTQGPYIRDPHSNFLPELHACCTPANAVCKC